VSEGVPTSFDFPDLSVLNPGGLVTNWVFVLIFGPRWPEGNAQWLVTALGPSCEAVLDRYESARRHFEDSTQSENPLHIYMRGLIDMELTFMALNRAMRLVEKLRISPETTLGREDVASTTEQDRIRHMRNAIDHSDGPIVGGHSGKGNPLSLEVRERDMSIYDTKRRQLLTATHQEVGEWIQRLWSLALDLIRHPEKWSRGPVGNKGEHR
jgi:hypothetical protein